MVTLRVRIEPLEPMLFGDNRSARTGERHAVGDQDPSPATLFGAVGARIAHRLGAGGQRRWAPAEPVLGPFVPEIDRGGEEAETAELLGYTLCDAAGRAWFPQPRHLRGDRIGDAVFALELLRPVDSPALSSLPSGWRPLGAMADAEEELEADRLVTEDLLAAVLSGTLEAPFQLTGSVREAKGFYTAEPRLGLAMHNASNTAEPGRLFARPYRRFQGEARAEGPSWESAGFLAWLRVLGLAGQPESFFDGTAFVGGDRRRASLRFAQQSGPQFASLLEAVQGNVGESRGYLLYLLTPARIPADGLVTFHGESPVGGAVGRTVYASGWSGAAMAPGPRPLLALLPAGSVFFFEWGAARQSEAARRQWIAEQWLAALDPACGRAGFGRVLLGVWR